MEIKTSKAQRSFIRKLSDGKESRDPYNTQGLILRRKGFVKFSFVAGWHLTAGGLQIAAEGGE